MIQADRLGWQPISSSASYALHAVLQIAYRAPESVRAHELAASLEVPPKYLAKVLNTLAHAGILASSRGPHGGFRLAVEPHRLRLADVIAPFETLRGQPRCLLRGTACDPEHPCLAHSGWQTIAQQVHEFFRTRTVAEVAQVNRVQRRDLAALLI